MESLFLSLGWWLHPGLLCHRDFDPRFSFVLGSIPATRQSRPRKHPDSLHPPFPSWTSCPAFWRRASIRFEENIIVVKGCFKDNIILSVIKCNKIYTIHHGHQFVFLLNVRSSESKNTFTRTSYSSKFPNLKRTNVIRLSVHKDIQVHLGVNRITQKKYFIPWQE